MYEVYLSLANQKGVSNYKVSKDTGIPYTTLSDWKFGKSKPKIDKLQKLADYFQVDVMTFLEN